MTWEFVDTLWDDLWLFYSRISFLGFRNMTGKNGLIKDYLVVFLSVCLPRPFFPGTAKGLNLYKIYKNKVQELRN